MEDGKEVSHSLLGIYIVLGSTQEDTELSYKERTVW